MPYEDVERWEDPSWTPPPPKEPRRRRRRTGPWWSPRGRGFGGLVWRLAALIGVVFVAWAVAGFVTIWNAAKAANAGVTPAARTALQDPGGGILSTPENTLIIGSDARRGQTRSRADTIMIMRTDPSSGRVKFLSVPRDMRVSIPRYGEVKINAAFLFLGQRGMIRAVNRLTGLPVNHLIVVRFRGLPSVVDAVGGIEVNNPTALDCRYSGGTRVQFAKGRIPLNGERALVYSRVRYDCGDDFARMTRQQAIVAALKAKIVSPLSLPMAPWRGSALVRSITTDLSPTDLVKMGWLQSTLDARPDDRMRLVGTPERINGQDYVINDGDRNVEIIRRFVA